MKKIFSVLIFVLFISSGYSNTNKQIKSVIVAETNCSLFAYYAGVEVQNNGGDFWEAYFAAYAYCLKSIDPI